MKKERISIKLFGSSLVVTAFITLAGAGTSCAGTDMAGMMAEGIPYECAEVPKCKAAPNDNRAATEALMAEGIVYADSVIADDAVLIKLDHRQTLLQGMEACLCEDPTSLVVASQIANTKHRLLSQNRQQEARNK
ncbi:MAG: hypothetical protein KKC76_15495 [Proteobacteria bacterium]|nr:hypothetical protein [Pseudomonadota bacterium]MBU4294512.1 hypothetical protein [Pseudomonadota bacterium]MCG2747048.1 hypothetical protein [Desulfobulbaceae bacterium]